MQRITFCSATSDASKALSEWATNMLSTMMSELKLNNRITLLWQIIVSICEIPQLNLFLSADVLLLNCIRFFAIETCNCCPIAFAFSIRRSTLKLLTSLYFAQLCRGWIILSWQRVNAWDVLSNETANAEW